MTAQRILVVEDNSLIGQSLSMMMKQLGYETAGPVQSGEQALRVAEELVLDAVLVDVLLAGDMNGIDTAIELRKRFDLPAVIVTANEDELLLLRARDAEPFGLLLKPFRTQELKYALETALYKHQMERRLLKSEELCRQLYEHTPLPAQTVDAKGTIVEVNKAWTELTGYSREETVGRQLAECIQYAGAEQITEGFLPCMSIGWCPYSRLRIATKNGHVVTVEPGGRIFTRADGDFDRAHCFFKDVTEKTCTETALSSQRETIEALLNAQTEQAFLVDLKGKVVAANNAGAQGIGQSIDEVSGTSAFEMMPGETPARAIAVHEEVVRTQSRIEHIDKRDGRLMKVTVTPVFGRDGTVEGTAIFTADVTEKVNVETALQEARTALYSEISNRKQAQRNLRLSEARYRPIVNEQAELICRFLPDGTLTFVNKSFAAQTGDTAENLIGTSFFKLMPAEDRSDLALRLAALRPDNSTVSLEQRFFNGADKEKTIHWTHHLLFDDSGKPLEFQSVGRDVTEQRSRVQALKRLALVFENVQDAVIIADPDGRITEWNKSACALFGYSKDEALGRPFWFHLSSKDSRQKVEALKSTVKHSAPWEGELRAVSKTGARLSIQMEIQPVTGENGDVTAIVAFCRDVTAKRRAERSLLQMSALFREATDPIFILDLEGNVIDLNEEAERVYGWSRESLSGRSVMKAVPVRRRARVTALLEQCRSGLKVRNVESSHVTASGWEVPVLVSLTLLSDEKDRPTSMAMTGHDLSLIKAAEQELIESEQRFRAVFRSALDCVYIKDRSLRYTSVNPYMASLLGLPESRIIGLTDADLFGPRAGEHLIEVDYRVLGGESVEEEHRRPIGGYSVTFHDVKVPMYDSHGKIIGICGISRNITERTKPVHSSPLKIADFPSRAMKNVMAEVKKAAGTNSIVLLTGESGSGKDFVARIIHDESDRANGPYFTVNCAAVPQEMAESELFGHEAGAFTGAARRKRGMLELAEGGTLLLNEIGELSPPLQSKLLTFLDSRTFTRVGGEKPIRVSARLMAATNRDLEQEVRKGRFRADLFYRLNVLAIRIPPLRERQEDIPLLVDRMITELAHDLQLHKVPVPDESTAGRLSQYRWPGNVRELRNVLERALIISDGDTLTVSLSHENEEHDTERGNPEWRWTASFPPVKPPQELARDLRRRLIEEALLRSKGKRSHAARLLGISRHSLRRQMESSGVMSQSDTATYEDV
jgi:PAS domain S-box-containing protein